jgi:hypothetical protein
MRHRGRRPERAPTIHRTSDDLEVFYADVGEIDMTDTVPSTWYRVIYSIEAPTAFAGLTGRLAGIVGSKCIECT